MALKLPRRTFLTGLAGTAVALPVLEAMGPMRVFAAPSASKTRFLVGFAGTALGTSEDHFVPDVTGPGYDLKRALSPLGTRCEVSGLPGFEIASEVSVVSGLEIPWRTGDVTPEAGRGLKWHPEQLAPLFTGRRARDDFKDVQAPSADQLVADLHDGDTLFRSLAYRVQPSRYRTYGVGFSGRMSYRRRDDGRIEPVDPVVSPQAAYEALFAGFSVSDPEEEARRQFELSRRRSILDLVGRGQRDRLVSRLGAADRRRMERHFDHIRDLERRLAELGPDAGGACEMLEAPGPDPEIGGISREAGGGDWVVDGGYSNEELRAQVMSDLIAMAFTCDLTRSASLVYTIEQCFMMPHQLPGIDHTIDVHALSHNNGSKSERAHRMADILAWHTRHFGYLLDKLRSVEDEPDRSVLDNTVAVWMPEGGRGFDPATGNEDSPHSSQNMAVLVAGRAGGLRPGRHIVAPSDRNHPGNVMVSALNAAGVETSSFGAVTGGVEALFG